MFEYHRKTIRLKNYNYSTTGAYFITICTKNREPILSKIISPGTPRTSSPTILLSDYGTIVENTLKSIQSENISASVDHYIIMPDHIHFILSIVGCELAHSCADPLWTLPAHHAPQTQIVPRTIAWFKRTTNKNANCSLWQRSYHDHIIRNKKDYLQILQYIEENPIRWIQKHETK